VFLYQQYPINPQALKAHYTSAQAQKNQSEEFLVFLYATKLNPKLL
jgi:hypothetical protein